MSPYIIPGIDRDYTTMSMIERIVSQATGVYDLMAHTRKQRTVKPRQLSMWLMRQHTAVGVEDIARRYRKNHATVLHACRTVDNMRTCRDPAYFDLITHADRMVRLEKFKRHITHNTINV